MALSADDERFLKDLYQRLLDRPLQPGDPLYEPVYESMGARDPVQALRTQIEWSPVESRLLFSGFRGAGKTTELMRLRQNLRDQGYVVLYADALNYINPSEPIEISDLLMSLAGAFGECLEAEFEVGLIGEDFWTRVGAFLSTRLEVTEATTKLEATSPAASLIGGVRGGLDLKIAVRESTPFRKALQGFLANCIGELKAEVDGFFERGVRAIRQRLGEDKQVVFIFDQMEQIRGSLVNEGEVLHSVERLFANHLRMLELPYVHVVYTVPPWIQFVFQNIDKIQMLPSLCLWNNDEERTSCTPGWLALRGLTELRMGEGGCERLFGPADAEGNYSLADRLIGMCGGHFRDLLLLLRETVVTARSTGLPVSEETISAAITSVRNNFLPIAADDAKWLHEIACRRGTALPSVKPEHVMRLTRFLDTHQVLYLQNGSEWYDTHPLVREEVAKIVQHEGEAVSASGP